MSDTALFFLAARCAGSFQRRSTLLARMVGVALVACVALGAAALPAGAAGTVVHGLPSVNARDTVTRTVLQNGLTILVVEDHTTDIVAAEMLFRVGQVNEDDSTAGITNLIQNILVRRIGKAGGDDTNLVESKGSILNGTATPDYAVVSLLSDKMNYAGLLETIASAVAKRTFADEEVTEERRKMVEYLESDQRVFKAIYDIFLQQFYRYHPYRQPQLGHAASVRQLTRERLDAYYGRFYAPNRTVVAVVGDVNRDNVVRIIKNKMAAMTPTEERRLEVSWEPQAVEKELTLQSGSNLAWVFIGFPAPGMKSPDFMPMRLVHMLLGEGLSSRLWVELRERHTLAYELGSIYPMLEGPAHLIEYIVTTPKQVGEAQRRMNTEIERIRTTAVGEEELEGAKRKIIGAYLLEHETAKGRAFNLGLAELLGSGYQYDLQTIDRVRRVTPGDILRVCRTYLKDGTLVVARPRGSFFFP